MPHSRWRDFWGRIGAPFALLLFCWLAAACSPAQPAGPTEATPTRPAASFGPFTVYFSQPTSPAAQIYEGGPDRALAAAIDAARLSVDATLYDLDLWTIENALIAAHRRGVTVRVVAESDNLNRPEFQELMDAGIPVRQDYGPGLMHNKFVIIDRAEVWTGSMNLTINGAYRNDNNLVRVQSSRLADFYLAEFEEMFVDGLFGPASPLEEPPSPLNLDGIPLEALFSPDNYLLYHLVDLVDSAQESVHLLAFSFTSDELADALLRARERGVEVTGVFETSQVSSAGADFFSLLDLGLSLALDGNPHNMHHKVLIVDRKVVFTGSYNFTRSAEGSNDENALIIYNAGIAQIFLGEFIRIYQSRQ